MNRSQNVLTLQLKNTLHKYQNTERTVPILGDKARGWPTWTKGVSQVIRLLKGRQQHSLDIAKTMCGRPRTYLELLLVLQTPVLHYCLAQLHRDLEMLSQSQLKER